jgi:hypothetical protein
MYLFIILAMLLTSCVDVNVKKIPCDCTYTIDTILTCNQLDASDPHEDTDSI